MRTRSNKKNTINVITLGCSKNTYDSEVLMGQLKANKKQVVHEKAGNIVVVNTCGFIGDAKAESVNTILEQVQKKQAGEVDKVFVTGCLSERYKPDLEAEIPEVDAYFGTTDLPQLLQALGADYKHELLGERLKTTPKNYAYLKIAEGCDRPCSFCAIPLMRGKHRSTPIEQLVAEAEKLAASGVKELILIAQDLTYYGLDLYKKRRLADLLGGAKCVLELPHHVLHLVPIQRESNFIYRSTLARLRHCRCVSHRLPSHVKLIQLTRGILGAADYVVRAPFEVDQAGHRRRASVPSQPVCQF